MHGTTAARSLDKVNFLEISRKFAIAGQETVSRNLRSVRRKCIEWPTVSQSAQRATLAMLDDAIERF